MKFAAPVLLALCCACTFGKEYADKDKPPQRAATATAGSTDPAVAGLRFDAGYDGGTITLERDSSGTLSTDSARTHIKDMATRFATADFAVPGLSHTGEIPGVAEMTMLIARIRFTMDTTRLGGMLKMASPDTIAVNAIHDFIEFQRSDYRVGPQNAQKQ